MTTSLSSTSSYRLIGSQALNAFGDHAAKITASSLVAATFAERQASVWVGVISLLYILPYVALAPLAGRAARRVSKATVVRGALALQVGALAGLSLAAALGSFVGVVVALALVACQSSLLAPSRNALLKDLCGTAKLGKMMGLLGLAGVGATLAGLALGGWSFDRCWEVLGSPWTATAVVAGSAAGAAALALVVVMGLRDPESHGPEQEVRFRRALGELMGKSGLRWLSLGLAWFYGVGAMLVMILLQDSRWEHGQEAGAASQGGAMAALLGLGVAGGSGLAAYLCRRRIEIGLSFLGALALAGLTPLAAYGWENDGLAMSCVFLMGVAGGLFSAPLNAQFVASARDEARVAILAANNLAINVVSGGFIGLAAAMGYWGWAPATQLWVVAATSVAVVATMAALVPESLLRVALMGVVKLFYPMAVHGRARLPEKGGALIVANHVSYMDALLIWAASDRPTRFVGTSEMLKRRWMRWVYRKFKVIAVSPDRAKEAVRATVEALKAGDVVCVFPEGALTRTGMLMPFRGGAELIARLSGCPVVPVHIDGMWGSVFSFADKPFRYRCGMPLRRRLRICFGESIPSEAARASVMRDAVMKLGYEAFERRSELAGSLGKACLQALGRRRFRRALVDHGLGGRALSGLELAVAAVRFQRVIGRFGSTRRVGILLPPGIPGIAANLGALLAGKSAVNLNPTAGAEVVEAMAAEAELDCVVTSRQAMDRFKGLTFGPARTVYVEDLAATLSGWKAKATWAALALAPSRWLDRAARASRRGGDAEAFLLFSSGSSGRPKGIPLSHRNLLANAYQLSECYLMRRGDRVLSNLPMFHSFGLTGGWVMPLLKGLEIVTTPTPLQPRETVKAIARERATVLLGTPTFLRGYLAKAKPEEMRSLRLTVAGAEALPRSLAEAWEDAFGSPVLEGYGLTECAPVVAVNCLRSEALIGRYAVTQIGSKAGTVGRPLPGVWARIVQPEAPDRLVEIGETGLIWVKGPNVARSYLDGSRERWEADGWFNTGDLGSLDADGCLRIEGRLSRFSKVGGEMVSHRAVEEAIEAAFPELSGGSVRRFHVGGAPCERKGEALALLSCAPIDRTELGRRLRERGMPNLWAPQRIRIVDSIPMLGSGKVDLKACQELLAGEAAWAASA